MALDDVVAWLQRTGYPFDWSSDYIPPLEVRVALEKAWPDAEGLTDPTERSVYSTDVAEAGGWLNEYLDERHGRERSDSE